MHVNVNVQVNVYFSYNMQKSIDDSPLIFVLCEAIYITVSVYFCICEKLFCFAEI